MADILWEKQLCSQFPATEVVPDIRGASMAGGFVDRSCCNIS